MPFRGIGWLEIGFIMLAVLIPAALVIAVVLYATRRSAASTLPEMLAENNSGRGSGTPVPVEIRGWNWGGFFLTWIWGIGNNVWIALLALIPFPLLHLVMAVILGFQGNEWAWQSQRWNSVEHFRNTQRTWGWAGLVIALLPLFVIVLGVLTFRWAA